jgi:hypothetical protein
MTVYQLLALTGALFLATWILIYRARDRSKLHSKWLESHQDRLDRLEGRK